MSLPVSLLADPPPCLAPDDPAHAWDCSITSGLALQAAPSWVGFGQPAGLPPLGPQVPPGGNKTQYEEIGIPVALLSHKDMVDIFKVGSPVPCSLSTWWVEP